MAVLLDTSVLIELEREPTVLEAVLDDLGEQTGAIAAITASELLHGVLRADTAQRRDQRGQIVERLLSALTTYPFDLAVARHHARIWADLKTAGRMIGAHDLLIAATAVAHGLRLVTRNPAEFRRVEGLVLVEGW